MKKQSVQLGKMDDLTMELLHSWFILTVHSYIMWVSVEGHQSIITNDTQH